MNIRHLVVRDENREWGEFFVSEREPRICKDGDREYTQYTATWCCYSSFGVYGHHWYAMGRPFAEFMQGVEEDYLLSKICQRVQDLDKIIKNVKREVLKARREHKCIDKQEARDAWDAIHNIEADACDPSSVPALLYEDSDISKCHIEWCDLDTMSYPNQARQFVRKIWPAFVKAYNEEPVAEVTT